MNPAALLLTFLLMIILNPIFAGRPPLIDIHDNLIESGTQYLIVPVTHYDGGGGLTLPDGAPTNDHTHTSCHVNIIQATEPNFHGLPVTFSPRVAAGDDDKHRPVIIFGSMDLNIRFAAPTACAKSPVWKVSEFHHEAHKSFVVVGGEKETDHRSSPSNWFKILRVKQHQHNQGGKSLVMFKIVACSSACNVCHVSCKDVGVFVDAKTGARRLALTNHEPLLVQFKKV